jgi:hypothetical protein
MTDELMRTRLEEALDRGGGLYGPLDVIEAVRGGQMQAFHCERGFVVSEIRVFPRKRVLHLIAVCGELDAVLELQPQVVAFAREHGCDMVTAVGRRGWLREPRNDRGEWKEAGAFFVWALED